MLHVTSHRRAARAAILLLLGACRAVSDPPPPRDAQPFDPPPVYARWWAMTEACADVSGSLAAVSWYVVPGATRVSNGSDQVSAYWVPRSNRIVVAGEAQLNGALVRHEMLHALLRGQGHARSVFLGRCSGVVTCGPECVADAEPPPEPGANVARVTADALEVGVAISPAAPSSAREDGFFTVTVTARNPAPHPVVVVPAGGGSLAQSFTVRLAADYGVILRDDAVRDPSVAQFAAGETKRQVYDFLVVPHVVPGSSTSGAYPVPPGAYTVHARYDTRAAAPVALPVSP